MLLHVLLLKNTDTFMLKNLRSHLYFLLVFSILTACSPHALITKVESGVIPLDSVSVIKEDTSALRIIKPFSEKMDSEMNEVLAYSDQAIIKGTPESLLNNFVSDLLLKKANDFYQPIDKSKIDFCLLNNGGLRQALPKGAITLGKVYELMPFENNLVVLTLTGEKTKQIFDYIAKIGGEPISGFTMGIKDTLAVNITINGKPFDISRNYKVITSDYLANGGDKMKFLNDPVKREDIGVKVRDAIIIYMKEENKKRNTLKAKLDKRIYYEK